MPSTQVAPLVGPTMPKNAQPRPVSSVQYIDEIITFSPVTRLLIRSMILFLVVFNAALLALFAVLYMQNEKNGSLLWLFRIYFLYSESNAFLMHYSTRVALGYALLSSLFGLVAVRMLWRIVPSRLKRLQPFKRFKTHYKTCNPSPFTSTRTPEIEAHTTSVFEKVKRLYHRWHRAVGVRGPYFDVHRLTGEIFEIVSQTAAALSASQSISSVPLNIIYAVVIFLNSICSFVFRRVFRKSLVKQRIACLLTDLVLDFVWGTLLPIWMYLPIVKIWLDRANIIDYLESFANSTREIERVLVISWKLYALSVIPFCNSLLSILKLHDTVQQLSRARTMATVGLLPNVQQTGTDRSPSSILVRLVHAILPIYGVAVLVMTLSTDGVVRTVPQTNQFPCMHRVYPWFSTKEACLGRQINCTSLGIEGNRDELQAIFQLFDKASLADLFLMNCPHLEIAHDIQSFNRLMSIVIKDSTLVEWSEAAMLSHTHFQELRTVQLYNVAIEQDPLGLVGSVAPITPSIEWIHLENVDGRRILDLVGDHWKGLLFFDCMGCRLTAIPEALYLMPKLTAISLSINNLTSIPDDWLPRSQLQLQAIWVDFNAQLTSHPDSLWRQAATCGVFSMSWTNLSVVPEWVAEIAGADFQLTAIDTPVCVGFASLSPKLQSLVACE